MSVRVVSGRRELVGCDDCPRKAGADPQGRPCGQIGAEHVYPRVTVKFLVDPEPVPRVPTDPIDALLSVWVRGDKASGR